MRVPEPTLQHPPRAVAAPVLRLPTWQRRGFYGVFGVLLASGVAWLAAHYFLRQSGEFGPAVHPLEPWSMKLHGAAAMAALWWVGSLLQVHVRRALAAGRNLPAGWGMIALLAWLTLSGYGLYYLASEESRPLWSGAHWIAGMALPLLVWVHVRTGRRGARA